MIRAVAVKRNASRTDEGLDAKCRGSNRRLILGIIQAKRFLNHVQFAGKTERVTRHLLPAEGVCHEAGMLTSRLPNRVFLSLESFLRATGRYCDPACGLRPGRLKA